MTDPSKAHFYVRGVPIATRTEVTSYVYAVPEDLAPPAIFTRFVAGEEVDPRSLFDALDGEGRVAAGDSDSALAVLELLKARLLAAFPDELSP